MGVELLFAVIGLYFSGIAVVLLVLLAPTLLAVALKRDSIFSIIAVNVIPSFVGLGFLGRVLALAWAIFGARREPRLHYQRSNWDILP